MSSKQNKSLGEQISAKQKDSRSLQEQVSAGGMMSRSNNTTTERDEYFEYLSAKERAKAQRIERIQEYLQGKRGLGKGKNNKVEEGEEISESS